MVWDKSGGKCWYCGCVLPEKGWHADHVEPIIRGTEIVPVDERKDRRYLELRPTGESLYGANDTIENMVPSCAPCNLFKSTFTVEAFRGEIEQQVARARKTSVNFRTAERFGLIESTELPVVFWFESRSDG